jgi:hypothetical protein
MIVRRSPCNPVIGDTVLLRAQKGGVSAPSSTRMWLATRSIGAEGEVNFRGMPAPS